MLDAQHVAGTATGFRTIATWFKRATWFRKNKQIQRAIQVNRLNRVSGGFGPYVCARACVRAYGDVCFAWFTWFTWFTTVKSETYATAATWIALGSPAGSLGSEPVFGGALL